MSDKHSAELNQLVSHEQVENAFWKALRMFVGRGRRFSADELSKGSGVHRRSLDCYRGYPIGHPDHWPLDQGQKFSLASYIGSDLTTEWLALIGQGAFDLPDDEPDPGELAAEGAQDSATLVRAAVDGTFDKDERADLRVIGARKIKRGQQLIALGRAA